MHSSDFKRVLATSPQARSAHFAVYHGLPGGSTPAHGAACAAAPGLSTDHPGGIAGVVDNLLPWQLGVVLPKRHARRAVTRNLVRRQIRAAMLRHLADLPHGQWLVRLRQGFDAGRFPSAASPALRQFVRAELDALLTRAVLRRRAP